MESLVINDNYLKSVQFGERPGASEDSQEQLLHVFDRRWAKEEHG